MPVKVEIDHYVEDGDGNVTWPVKVIDVESGLALEFSAEDIDWPWPDDDTPERPW